MRVNKSQLEAMIRESVKEEIGNLNEEELQELLGGLRGLAGGAANAAKRAGGAIAGAARGAGQAVAGATRSAATAVKGAYQAGEKQAAIANVEKQIQGVEAALDKALQAVAGDRNAQNILQGVKNQASGLINDLEALQENKNPPKRTLRKKTK